MPKLGWPLQLSTTPVPFPFSGSHDHDRGTDWAQDRCPRAVYGLSCLASCKEIVLWHLCLGLLPMGFRGLRPEVRGSHGEQLWEPWGLPYLRQEGRERALCVGWR